MIDPAKITATLLKEDCGAGAYSRGAAYFQQGRATIVESRFTDDGIILLCRTRGSRIYAQQIVIGRTRHGLRIDGICDCPVGFNCKHIVAACLTWKAQSAVAGLRSPASAGAFEQWLARFSGNDDESVPTSGEALLYLLKPAPGRGKGLELDFVVAKRRPAGWSKGRRASLSALSSPYRTSNYRQPVDEEIVTLLEACNPHLYWGSHGTTLSGAAGHTALGLMLDSGRLFWHEDRKEPLHRGEGREAVLYWVAHRGHYRLHLDMRGGWQILPVAPPCYLDLDRREVGELRLPGGIDARRLALLEEAPPVPRKEAGRIGNLLARQFPGIPTPEPVTMAEVGGPPTPRLAVNIDPDRPLDPRLTLGFRYGKTDIDPADPEPVIVREQGKGLLRIHRDIPFESAARATLQGQDAVELQPGRFALANDARNRQEALEAWFRFVETTVPYLEAQGWEIEQAAQNPVTLSHAGAIDAEVDESGNDWFGLRFDLDVEGRRVPLLPLVSEVIGDYRPGELPETLYLDAGGGCFIAVGREHIEPILQTIVDLFDRDGGDGEAIRLSRLDAPRLLELGGTRIHGGETLQKLARRLRDFDGIKRVKPPATFKGELRGYQQQGLDWLQFLREYELAGILADDMGLGKTVQTLAHLAVEKQAGRMKHPSFIIAPTSLMGNWRREAARFTPDLRVLVLHGPGRGEHFDTLDEYDLILTTYPLLPRDHEVLLAQPCHYLILDEAQQIKNPRSQAAQLVRAIRAEHRLCLTGTPMENHLGELWAQFDFLLPGFLGSQEQFVRRYRTPIEKHGDRERLTRLAQRTAPFMLRRTKDVVAAELPPKSEILRTVPIEGRQVALYESIRLTMEKKVRDAIAKKGLARSRITILDALLKLRQVCCDPRLLPAGTARANNAPSAKLAMLMELLPELLDEGRRILLFSQFTSMLGLIEQELEGAKIPYTKLTGQTRKRDEVIDAFRRGEVNLFLISLKAGGVGLNLTEADTVIHYDPWWNPAVETQATNRAHRIGQDKPVFVYKLVTEGTVEEKILALQARKQKLADSVYGKGREEGEPLLDAETIGALLAAD